MISAVLPASDEPGWVRRLDELHLLTPLRVLIIIGVTVVATMIVSRILAKALMRVLDRTGGDRPRAEARRKALTSALRGAVVGLLWTMAVITIVSEVGINIGAFVATATVVGGAVAFGAQTMVRDMIAGLFVLAEDQYAVGDDVDLGLASGTVEAISLRSARLRDGEGKVWHVPHGNVQRVGNGSKASAAWLDLHIDRGSDVGDALEIGRQLGAELRHNEDMARRLIGEPQLIGITDVRDDRFVVRVRALTAPNEGEAVRQAWRVLALKAFADGRLTPPSAPSTVIHLNPTTDAHPSA